MEQKYLKSLNRVKEQLEKLKLDVEKVKEELQEEYDNLSYETQGSEYGDELETVIEALDTILIDGLETADDELFNAVSSLEMLPTCDRGMDEDEDLDDDEDNWDVDVSGAVTAGALYFGFKAGNKKEEKPYLQSSYNPYDNHWESSFDWKDEDNDGYDDRDDGFWTPSEF